jgi:hypothetical protein
MNIRWNIPVWLMASSLAGGAALAGCVGDPGEVTDPAGAAAPPAIAHRGPEAAPAAAGAATAFTQAEDASTFAVFLQRAGKTQKLRSVKVAGHVNELSVEVQAAPSGERVAIAPNYDTFAGTELRVVDAEGGERVLEDARAASPVWSADSAELAYLVMNDHTFEVRTSDGARPGHTVATIQALRARLLGWSSDKEELYLILDSDKQGGPLVAFGVVDVATGALRTPFASDPETSTFYRDFQLVEAEDGGQLVSFVESSTLWPCGGTSRLVLATPNGSVVAEHGATTDSYSQARWSADAKRVAFEVRACADKQQGLAKAQARMDALNGIHLAEVGEAGSTRIASGLLHDYRLAGLRDGGVLLGSATRGLTALEVSDKLVDLHEMEAEPFTLSGGQVSSLQAPTSSAKNVTTQYVHQLWDTPDWFNGNSACGPTSSVMDLAGYQLSAWPMTASWPSVHTSNYGQYVATQYSYGGTTFSTATQDPSGNWAKGAYGHMVKDPNVGSSWSYIYSYLDIHLTWAVQDASGSIGGSWVRGQLDQNFLVVTSGSVFGYGHIIIIRGYTDDGRWYVNDPYGYQVSGNYNGANVIYTWANISPAHFWAG